MNRPGTLLFCVAAAGLSAQEQSITFSEHIAPIVFASCSPCHRPAEAAPFPLLSYEDTRKHAAQIVAVTSRRYMPPWSPEPGHGDFAGVRRLSTMQIQRIAGWVRAGAPQGDPSRQPAPPKFVEGWQLGEPDLIVKVPQSFTVPASGGDVFRNFVLPPGLKSTRYVRAMELRPGNKRVVHHANVVLDRTRAARRRTANDGQPGFPGMDVSLEAGDEFDPDSHFLFWKPGTPAQSEPEDMSWRLDPFTDLVVNLHLQPTGKPEVVQPQIGLYFSEKPPAKFPILVQLERDSAIDIPPGSRTFTIADTFKLPVAADLLAIYPHAHYLGKRIEAWATLPSGVRRNLLLINDWDINWQASYAYREPVALPAGATVAMRILFDNSADNPRNPTRPPGRVRAGNRSQDEMGHVWLQLLPRASGSGDPRMRLHQAVMRRRLEKDPNDFVAHYNLGAALQTSDAAEAVVHLERAVKLKPASAAARNALGASMMAGGQLDRAIELFRSVLAIDAGYGAARVNLARCLASKGDVTQAERELRTHLANEPDDANALYQLTGVLAAQNRFKDALPLIEKAAQLDPGNAEILANLGTLLAIDGQLGPAVAAFEAALRINPNDAATRANLDRAKESLRRR